MFNKQFTRFLCFFVCFCLCFAWFGEPMEAKASGTALVGLLLTYLIGCGIGFSISGTANSLADGLSQLVEEYETNVYDGEMDFWDLLALGSSIGTLGELLLNKAAVDALNGFMNWLQSYKGWSVGSEVSFSASKKQIKASLDPTASSGYVFLNNTSYTSFDGAVTDKHFIPISLGDVFSMEEANSYYFIGDVVWNWKIYFSNSTNTRISVYRVKNGSNYGSSLAAYSYLEAAGYTMDDVVGYTFSHESADSQPGYVVYLFFVLDDGSLIQITYVSSISTNLVSSTETSSVSIPDQLTSPDTTDWSDVYSLALHGGVSGSIPASIDDYNDQIISSLNEGVVPDVTTEVVVDQSGEIETDGTLLGFVEGIFDLVSSIPLQLSRIWESVKAIPETIIDGILTGVKSIFIPDPEDMNDQFMILLEEINDKYSFNFDLDTLFSGEKEPEDITAEYSAGSLSWNLTFVSWHYLKKGVQHFRPFIRGFIVLMLLFYNLRQFMAIFGLGGVMNGDSADRRVNDLAV